MERKKNFFNKGNDCDCCENQFFCGKYGDAVGCKCADEGKECKFIEHNICKKSRGELSSPLLFFYSSLSKSVCFFCFPSFFL